MVLHGYLVVFNKKNWLRMNLVANSHGFKQREHWPCFMNLRRGLPFSCRERKGSKNLWETREKQKLNYHSSQKNWEKRMEGREHFMNFFGEELRWYKVGRWYQCLWKLVISSRAWPRAIPKEPRKYILFVVFIYVKNIINSNFFPILFLQFKQLILTSNFFLNIMKVYEWMKNYSLHPFHGKFFMIFYPLQSNTTLMLRIQAPFDFSLLFDPQKTGLSVCYCIYCFEGQQARTLLYPGQHLYHLRPLLELSAGHLSNYRV